MSNASAARKLYKQCQQCQDRATEKRLAAVNDAEAQFIRDTREANEAMERLLAEMQPLARAAAMRASCAPHDGRGDRKEPDHYSINESGMRVRWDADRPGGYTDLDLSYEEIFGR